MTGTVGNLPLVPYMAANYGQAAILTPSDYFFARDGIAAEGTINQEQMVFADVDLDLLDELMREGRAAGQHTTDVHIAALAIEHQAEVFSNDTDFARFPGLHWTDPLR